MELNNFSNQTPIDRLVGYAQSSAIPYKAIVNNIIYNSAAIQHLKLYTSNRKCAQI